MRKLILITAVTLLAATACAQQVQPEAQPSAPTPTEITSELTSNPPLPTDAAAQPTPASTIPPVSEAPPEMDDDVQGASMVEAWYARDTPRGLFVEPEKRHLSTPTTGVARAAFEEVVNGDPTDPGLITVAPEGTRILDVRRRDSVLVLDLSEEAASPGGSAAEIAFTQQLAHTAAQFDGVESLRLLFEGERRPMGHLDVSDPIEPDESAVSPVVVTSPEENEQVPPGKLVARGTANVYEATVLLTLRDPDGNVFEKTFATATCGSGCRGTWRMGFRRVTQPGTWTLVAAASDPSDGEGGPPFKTTRTFTID